jgi:hypothetical protein
VRSALRGHCRAGAHAVAAALRRPRGDGAGACGLHRFEAHAGAEVQRRRRIGHDQADPLALGLEQLGVGAAGARGHAPVDVARVVAGHVLARLGVLHAAAAQRTAPARVAGAATAWRRRTLCQPPQRDQFGQLRAQPVTFDDGRCLFRGWIGHAQAQGAGTRASSSCTRRSPSQPSAVAS